MVLYVLSVPVLWTTGCTLIILMMVNGTKGGISEETKSLVENMLAKIKTIEEKVNKMSNGDVHRCDVSDGFFFAPGTGQSQCLKALTDKHRSWTAARDECTTHGLVLARPFNARALRQYLYERFNLWNFWVGARGDNTQFKWETDRAYDDENVSADSPLWRKDEPSAVTTERCMLLATAPNSIKHQPEQVYSSRPCIETFYVLCELDLTKKP